MTILFISDLHLEPKCSERAKLFIEFLTHQASKAEALYILGDFFEVWIGDDDNSNFTRTIIQALRNLTLTGIPVYCMHGNRDFLLGQKFMKQTGCQLLTDPTIIDLYGCPTLLTHGDGLCTDDISYLRYRAKVRHPVYQRIFLSLPRFIRSGFVRVLRIISQNKGKRATDIIDANMNAVRQIMQEHNVQLLIHGHTHRPSIQYFKLLDQDVCRIVLSDWEHQGNVLSCEPNRVYRLQSL